MTSLARSAIAFAALALLSCRAERHVEKHPPGVAPFDSPGSLPDAPLSGTIDHHPFALRDARYIVDRRIGYAHTDILLSSGSTDSPCGPVTPAHATSVWLRMDGPGAIEPKDFRIDSSTKGPWTVHYQEFEGETWKGVGEGGALLVINGLTEDGHLTGGLSVCFSDGEKSCVSGSFNAVSCPQRIDQPVRGTPALEKSPETYLQTMKAQAPVVPPDAGMDAALEKTVKH